MKIIFSVIFSVFTLGSISAQETLSSHLPVDRVPRFAEYGNLSFTDEKALLDHLASSFRKAPDRMIYILVYSDWRSCTRQGMARAVRAKNYLVKHHKIEPNRIVWKEGGFQNDLSVEVWLLGRDEPLPTPFPILDQPKVKMMRRQHCRK